MNFTQDQIAAIIGAKELERIYIFQQFNDFQNNQEAMKKRIAELEEAQKKPE